MHGTMNVKFSIKFINFGLQIFLLSVPQKSTSFTSYTVHIIYIVLVTILYPLHFSLLPLIRKTQTFFILRKITNLFSTMNNLKIMGKSNNFSPITREDYRRHFLPSRQLYLRKITINRTKFLFTYSQWLQPWGLCQIWQANSMQRSAYWEASGSSASQEIPRISKKTHPDVHYRVH